MVEAFHAAGIEVWLDVVYNHTAEGDQAGPTYSYRGVDNSSYYLLTPDRRQYVNDTGCGNTMRTGHPGARVLVLESLRFWARTMGVDGFRFDLASIFSRAADGTMNVHEASIGVRDQPARRACSTSGWSPKHGISAAISSAAGFPASTGTSGTASFATMCARSCAASRARWAR